jgi:hypothetical protein
VNTPRYTFDRYATKHDTCYSVSAVTDRGWMITWYVELAEDGGWEIWRSKPSNDLLYVKPTGTLGRRILAIVAATQARFSDQAVGGV